MIPNDWLIQDKPFQYIKIIFRKSKRAFSNFTLKRTIANVKRIDTKYSTILKQNISKTYFFYVMPKHTSTHVVGSIPISRGVKKLFQNVLKFNFKNFN